MSCLICHLQQLNLPIGRYFDISFFWLSGVFVLFGFLLFGWACALFLLVFYDLHPISGLCLLCCKMCTATFPKLASFEKKEIKTSPKQNAWMHSKSLAFNMYYTVLLSYCTHYLNLGARCQFSFSLPLLSLPPFLSLSVQQIFLPKNVATSALAGSYKF